MSDRRPNRGTLLRAFPGVAFVIILGCVGVTLLTPPYATFMPIDLRGPEDVKGPTIQSLTSDEWMKSMENRAADEMPAHDLLVETSAFIQHRVLNDPIAGDYYLRGPSSTLLRVGSMTPDVEGIAHGISAMSGRGA